MGRMGRGLAGVPVNGAAMPLLPLRVDRRERSAFTLPSTLSSFDSAWEPPANLPAARVVRLEFRHMQWLLNGRVFEMEGVAPDETVAAGSPQIWEFDNTTAMMGMHQAHPLHLHGRQFRVLSRQIDPAWRSDWNALSEGFVDEGWQDTVLVMPGERVRLLVRFSNHRGLYLYHCHNLEHEDMGMMRNYRIV